ncbi:MAG: hypothetical protein N3A72_07685, partial [bacterium]|nr:hypothetical protein [bacterium]
GASTMYWRRPNAPCLHRNAKSRECPRRNSDMCLRPSNDIAKSNPWICQEARDKYTEWHTAMMHSMPEGYTVDPMQTVLNEGGPYHAKGYLKEYCKHLEKTGRSWAIPELKKRHPKEFDE